MISPVCPYPCCCRDFRYPFFKIRQQGNIININNGQLADLSGNYPDIARTELIKPVKDVVSCCSSVLVFFPVDMRFFLFVNRNRLYPYFRYCSIVLRICFKTLPGPVKSPDKSRDSNHALTAFQLCLYMFLVY